MLERGVARSPSSIRPAAITWKCVWLMVCVVSSNGIGLLPGLPPQSCRQRCCAVVNNNDRSSNAASNGQRGSGGGGKGFLAGFLQWIRWLAEVICNDCSYRAMHIHRPALQPIKLAKKAQILRKNNMSWLGWVLANSHVSLSIRTVHNCVLPLCERLYFSM